MKNAEHLNNSNIFYRRPDLYDQVQGDATRSVTGLCEQMITTLARANTRTLLDFGCGTGRDLEYFATKFDCVGVDVQPRMVEYARDVRPDLDIRLGDMRSFRLGREVDVITCLGNSLTYLPDNDDLQDVFDTFAAHSHVNTLLIIYTMIGPIGISRPSTSRMDVADLHADVTIDYAWNPRTQINTMRRHWQHDDGREEDDEVIRRVIYPRELELYLTHAGFEPLQMFSRPGDEPADLGVGAYVVAQYR